MVLYNPGDFDPFFLKMLFIVGAVIYLIYLGLDMDFVEDLLNHIWILKSNVVGRVDNVVYLLFW